MQTRKWMVLFLVLALVITLISGCKTPQGEEGAMADGYVENNTESTVAGNSSPAVRGEGQVSYETTQKPDSSQEEVEDGDTPVSNTDKEEEEPSAPENTEDAGSFGEEEATPPQAPEESETPEEPQEGEEEGKEEEEEENEIVVVPDSNSESSDSGQYIKVVSYNIRYANDPDGRSIKERAPRLKKLMNEYNPDIIGFQEVTPKWVPYLNQDYAGEYAYFHKYRSVKDKEGAPIYWKADKFQLLESGSFWLSETPDVESKGWNGSHVRMAMWVKLKVRATGKEFLFINTHYDVGSKTAQNNSPALVIQRMKDLGGFTKYPVIFTADCNANPKSTCYKNMYKAFVDVNAELTNDQTGTYNGYGKSNSLIDYCFISPKLITPLKYKVINSLVDGNYASDHNGVYAVLKLN